MGKENCRELGSGILRAAGRLRRRVASKPTHQKTVYNCILLLCIFLFGRPSKIPKRVDGTVDAKSSTTLRTDFTISKDSLISLLPNMKAENLDCSADIYWRIIQRGQSSIPLLIESLTDTTMTAVYDPCKKGNLNVGEVAYFALAELAEFPAYAVMQIQFDVIDENGCWSFFDFLFDNHNKKEYQKKVREFYASKTFVFNSFDANELDECRKKYHITGKLQWKE